MDGKEMKEIAPNGKSASKLISEISERYKINLLSRADKLTAVLFSILFIASVVFYLYLIQTQDISVYEALPVMAIPFFVIGAIFYILKRRYYAMIVIVILSVIAYLIMPDSVLYVVYLLVCAEGVVQMVDIIQRLTFYVVMSSIEHVNIKEKISIKDRAIIFLFNIPVDIDTRNLKIDKNIIMDKLPWKDMFYSMLLALMFCMFLWIYLFLNPSFSLETSGVPIYTFTIVLYLAMLVMPWSVFNTLNARVETEYRDFKIYTGFLETFKKMFLPVFAAIVFLISTVASGPDNLYYVAMSLGMIVVMIIFTSVMYYTSNEVDVVNDIIEKWEIFHPSSLYAVYAEGGRVSSLDDGVPGTPRRDPLDCFIPDIKNQVR